MVKYWIESPSELINSSKIIPFKTMNLPDQLNAITRLVIVIFIALFLIGFPYSFHFVIISILFLIILCYIQRNTMNLKENYDYGIGINNRLKPTNPSDGRFQWNGLGPGVVGYAPANLRSLAPTKTITASDGKKYIENLIQTPQQLTFCNDEVSIDPPVEASVGLNQRLAGGSNPVTKIAPIVLPPTHDLQYWRDNNLIVHSAINSEGIQKDMYLSGYAESTCCGYLGNGAELVPQGNEQIIEGFCNNDPYRYPNKKRNIVAPTPVEDIPFIPQMQITEKYNPFVDPIDNNFNKYCNNDPYQYPTKKRNIVAPTPVEDLPFIPSVRVSRPSMPVVEGYTGVTVPKPNKVYVQPNRSGWVNTACGYNPEQVFTAGLPSNLPAGNCEQNPELKQYNNNLFTQTITPGVYTKNQVNEPINSNIGISFQQQFEPVTCRRDDKGLHYLQHDPRIIEPVAEIPVETYTEKATYDNVFDPRFYGYGTSYRSYIDPMLGQPKFMYDDVNAIRQPNYVIKSKIDFLPYADSYGPVQEGSEMGNIHNPNIRALVQDSWMRDSLQFRDDISERRMRKINSEGWQQRASPFGARQVGSFRK
jgi:hypothetical protein